MVMVDGTLLKLGRTEVRMRLGALVALLVVLLFGAVSVCPIAYATDADYKIQPDDVVLKDPPILRNIFDVGDTFPGVDEITGY